MKRSLRVVVALSLLAGCRSEPPRRDAASNPRAPGRPPIAPRPTPAQLAAIQASVAASNAAAAASVAAAAAATDAGPAAAPGRTFEGPGIRVVIRPDLVVEVRAVDLWDGGLDQIFQSCAYVRDSMAPLRRTLPAAQVAVLVRACGTPRPGERPAAARPAAARPAAAPAR